jgi:hypothetical protein
MQLCERGPWDGILLVLARTCVVARCHIFRETISLLVCEEDPEGDGIKRATHLVLVRGLLSFVDSGLSWFGNVEVLDDGVCVFGWLVSHSSQLSS